MFPSQDNSGTRTGHHSPGTGGWVCPRTSEGGHGRDRSGGDIHTHPDPWGRDLSESPEATTSLDPGILSVRGSRVRETVGCLGTVECRLRPSPVARGPSPNFRVQTKNLFRRLQYHSSTVKGVSKFDIRRFTFSPSSQDSPQEYPLSTGGPFVPLNPLVG